MEPLRGTGRNETEMPNPGCPGRAWDIRAGWSEAEPRETEPNRPLSPGEAAQEIWSALAIGYPREMGMSWITLVDPAGWEH